MLFNHQKLSLTLKLGFLGVMLFTVNIGGVPLQAAECGILKLQSNRNPGANIISNSCTSNNQLALASTLQIQAGARLWLESANDSQKSGNFHIICQNKSSEPLKIKVNSPVLPWISPENSSQCNDWANNRLECNESGSEKTALSCAIAQINSPPVIQTMQRKTSLAMRGLKRSTHKPTNTEASQKDIDQWLSYLKPEIDLCRKVFNTNQPITLSWKIKASGDVVDTLIKESSIDNQLAECAIEVIENFDFPLFEKDTQITFLF